MPIEPSNIEPDPQVIQNAPPVDPPVADPAVTPEPQVSDFSAKVAAAGFEGQFSSEDELIDAYAKSTRQQQELEDLARLGAEVMPQYSEFQNWNQQRAQEAQKAQQAAQQAEIPPWREEANKAWEKPEFSEQWQQLVDSGMVAVNDQGKFIAHPDSPVPIPPDTLLKMNSYRDWERTAWRNFSQDPFDVITRGLKTWVRDIATEVAGQQLGGAQAASHFNAIEEQNAAWMYQADPAGNPVMDRQGQRVPTEEGKLLFDWISYYRSIGVTDPTTVFTEAFDKVAPLLQAKAGSAPTPPAAKQDPKTSFLQDAAADARRPDASGNISAGSGTPDPASSEPLEGMFLREGIRQGVVSKPATD